MSSTNKLSALQPIPYMGQVDNLPTDSQPDPTETLDAGQPTSMFTDPSLCPYNCYFR